METPESSELSAFVRLLRAQGLAVGGDTAVVVAPPRGDGGPEATIELPEDLLVAYLDRRWFEATEEEFEAIGGDPREHAWRLWCRTVASLPAHSPAARVALVESPGGEVLLCPDDPTGPQYVWSAHPGT